jgi:hypothetical protein
MELEAGFKAVIGFWASMKKIFINQLLFFRYAQITGGSEPTTLVK